jgi:photosystem II stability/assembly factor-like uncharacterized protein
MVAVGFQMKMRVLAVSLALMLILAGCGGSDAPSDPEAVRDDGPDHVHGLGVNPRDGALMVATHSGLFRVAEGQRELRRVGDLRQDTMGFTIVGPDRFLGSGHPDTRTNDPPHLGLIESDDGGKSWSSVSLRGDADLHALVAHSHVIYAFDSRSGRLLASGSKGRSWTTRRSPGSVIALALDPKVETRLVASTDEAVFLSTDGGATWKKRAGIEPGMLAWPSPRELLHVGADGLVSVSNDQGRTWRRRGEVPAQPVAMSANGDRVHVADPEGRIFASRDGGRTWTLLVEP